VTNFDFTDDERALFNKLMNRQQQSSKWDGAGANFHDPKGIRTALKWASGEHQPTGMELVPQSVLSVSIGHNKIYTFSNNEYTTLDTIMKQVTHKHPLLTLNHKYNLWQSASIMGTTYRSKTHTNTYPSTSYILIKYGEHIFPARIEKIITFDANVPDRNTTQQQITDATTAFEDDDAPPGAAMALFEVTSMLATYEHKYAEVSWFKQARNDKHWYTTQYTDNDMRYIPLTQIKSPFAQFIHNDKQTFQICELPQRFYA
jgi:hypothetical protein